MKEYIEKNALLDEICRDNCERTYDGTCHNCRMTEIIADFLAADVAEVRHGEWIGRQLDDFKKYESTCSECGWVGIENYDSYNDPSDFNYCPNCGAKMDGGNDK